MKISTYILSRFLNINLKGTYILIFLTAFILNSCSEDFKINEDSQENDLVELKIMVPEKESSFIESRAENSLNESESLYSNIYLVACNTDKNKVTVFNLTQELSYDENDGYSKTSVLLGTGNYRFYVVANLNQYISGSIDQFVRTENGIQSLISDFSTDKLITPGNLPMACSPAEIMVSGGIKNQNTNIIYLSNGSKPSIKADMTILCAKVRYTILFDAREGGISKGFIDNDKKNISFIVSDQELPYANYVKSTGQFTDITNKINNPDFNENKGDGWSHDDVNEFTATSSGVAEHWNRNFDSHQTLRNMEPGLYRLEVQGFYRFGSPKNSWEAHQNGSEQYNAKIYISNSESPLMSLYDENYGDPQLDPRPQDVVPPIDYPIGVQSANWSFNTDGKYKNNSVEHSLYQTGDLRIGIKKSIKHSDDDDWTCFDNFKLYHQSFDDMVSENNKIYLDLGRYTFDSNYLITIQNNDPILTPWDNANNSIDDWHNLDYKAWQGVVYLPENLTDRKTQLHFPYTYGTLNEKVDEQVITLFDSGTHSNGNASHGLAKGMMYDVVVLVKTPDKFNDNTRTFVKESPWVHSTQKTLPLFSR